MTPAERLSQKLRDTRRERVALVAFMTAGFPKREYFRDHLAEVAAHADVVEIGVPFTDPLADGVTIQRSSLAALAQGVTLHWILDELATMPKPDAELVLMGYLNPMLSYGYDALASKAASVGVSGFIVPDLPPEESADFAAALAKHGLALIRMVTPVTPQARLEKICASAQGFVYAVTMTGTTGGSAGAPLDTQLSTDARDYLERVKAASPVPVCAGFGIRSAGQVKAFAPYVDGVIVGSALVEALERGESAGSLLDRLRGPAA